MADAGREAAAAGAAGVGEGHLRDARHAHHLRVAGVRGQLPRRLGAGPPAADRGRGDHGQDEHAGVRARRRGQRQAHAASGQPLGPGAHARVLQRRGRVLRRRRAGPAGPRHRFGRLRAVARRPLRRLRAQADLPTHPGRPGVAGGPRPLAHRPHHPHGARQRAADGRSGRPRPARPGLRPAGRGLHDVRKRQRAEQARRLQPQPRRGRRTHRRGGGPDGARRRRPAEGPRVRDHRSRTRPPSTRPRSWSRGPGRTPATTTTPRSRWSRTSGRSTPTT